MRKTEIAIILGIICIIILMQVHHGTCKKSMTPKDPVAQQIEAIGEAFPFSDTLSIKKRAELVNKLLSSQ